MQRGQINETARMEETVHKGICGEKVGICGRIYGQVAQSRPLCKLVLARFARIHRQVRPGSHVGAIAAQREEVHRKAALGICFAHDMSSANIPDGRQ